MRKIIFKEKKAFTVAEIIVSMSVLALISVITVGTLLTSAERSKTEALISSQNFYNTITGLYMKVTSLSSHPVSAKTNDSETVLNSMLQYLDFTSSDLDCSKVEFNSFEADKCAKLSSGIKMGIKVDNTCNTTLDVYEYLSNDDKELRPADIRTRNVQKTCGYIIYRTRGSKGIFKEDAFIIPLGNKKLK